MIDREGEMRTPAVIAMLLLAAAVGLPQSRSFTGQLMDSQCAAMRTHDRMMKGVDAKDAKECSQKCVRLGGKYVLYDPATKTTYQVDAQEKSAAYAGQKVSVKGTYDAASKTIHVESVEAQ
jgi:hypothetical protein